MARLFNASASKILSDEISSQRDTWDQREVVMDVSQTRQVAMTAWNGKTLSGGWEVVQVKVGPGKGGMTRVTILGLGLLLPKYREITDDGGSNAQEYSLPNTRLTPTGTVYDRVNLLVAQPRLVGLFMDSRTPPTQNNGRTYVQQPGMTFSFPSVANFPWTGTLRTANWPGGWVQEDCRSEKIGGNYRKIISVVYRVPFAP